ncbi:MAG: hypothetical protein PHZ25_00600 [Candidatus Pacebacteria bacterium]|nr:hypothetical protein [Candidatus Paceibacterota bacterium]
MSIRASLSVLFIGFLATFSFLFFKDYFSKTNISESPVNAVVSEYSSFPQVSPQTFPSLFSDNQNYSSEKSLTDLKKIVEEITSPEIKNNPSVSDLLTPVVSPFFGDKTPSSLIDNQSVENPTLSEEEIFSNLWPDYYLSHLSKIQDLMVENNFISSAEKISFDSEEKIYNFLEKFSLFYKSVANLTDDEFLSLKEKLAKVPELKSEQRKELLKNKLSFLDLFGNFIKTAEASWIGVPPFCYKDLAPGNTAVGFSSPVFCCNCGQFCNVHGCNFVYDCGFSGAACTIQMGCLNSVCQGFPNAIWDPGTDMCGCG